MLLLHSFDTLKAFDIHSVSIMSLADIKAESFVSLLYSIGKDLQLYQLPLKGCKREKILFLFVV